MSECTCTIMLIRRLRPTAMFTGAHLNKFVASTGALLHHGGTNRLNKNVAIGQVS